MNNISAEKPSIDFMIIGHTPMDELVINKEITHSIGGVTYYSGIAAYQLGCTVAIVTKLSKEDMNLIKPLEKERIELFTSISKHTTQIRNVYHQLERISTLQARAEPFSIDDIPDVYAKVYQIGALLQGEVPNDVLSYIKEIKSKIALDIQGFIRSAKVGKKFSYEAIDLDELLTGIDFFKVDNKEAEFLTGETDVYKAVQVLGKYVPEIVLTYDDGVIVYDGNLYNVKFNVDRIVGRTGRGDTCFATYLTFRVIKNLSSEESCNYAAMLTSQKLAHSGPLESTDLLILNYL